MYTETHNMANSSSSIAVGRKNSLHAFRKKIVTSRCMKQHTGRFTDVFDVPNNSG